MSTRRVDRRKVREVLTRIHADLRLLHGMFEIEEFELQPEELVKPKEKKPGSRQVYEFIQAYGALYRRHMQAPMPPLSKSAPGKVRSLCETYGLERALKLGEGLLLTDDEWVRETDRGIDVLYNRAGWIDTKLREHGIK
jgi:hypothetical protein